MTYCTRQDMINQFDEDELISLTDRENNAVIVDAVLDPAIEGATSEIDTYLGQYPLPLAVVPDHLRTICGDIARFRLYKDHPTETVRMRYDDAIAWLKLVSSGKVKLNIPGQAASAPEFDGPDRVFTNDTLRGF